MTFIEDGKVVGRDVGDLIVTVYQDVLEASKKVATRKTYRSIRYEVEVSIEKISIKIYASESLVFIEKGRRKGAKLPVQKVNGKFELVDELKDWVVAVNYTGSHYILAKRISERGIIGVPITAQVIERIGEKIDSLLKDYTIAIIKTQFVQDIQSIYSAL